MSPLATPPDLEALLDTHRAPVEDALARALGSLEAHLPPDVAAAVRHGVTGGGKRLRPILCVSAYEACAGAAPAAVYELAASLELIHAYSLMHDDLPCMDDAELRRGRPTTHIEHGEDVTIRAGFALIPAAALVAWRSALALGVGEERARRVVRTLLQGAGAGGMVGGQWLDLLGEGRALGAEELGAVHARKTGALLTASLVIGAVAADAPEPVIAGVEEYGRAIGLAFQIMDDVLDATQSVESLGKNPSDAALEKSTYVALYGIEGARDRAEREIDRAIASLGEAGVRGPALDGLARYVVERRR